MRKLTYSVIIAMFTIVCAGLNAADFGTGVRSDYNVSKGKECSTTPSGKNESCGPAGTHRVCSLTDKNCGVSVSTETKKGSAKSKKKKFKKTTRKTAAGQ